MEASGQVRRSAAADVVAATTGTRPPAKRRSEEHTSELQSRQYLVCRLLLEKKKNISYKYLFKIHTIYKFKLPYLFLRINYYLFISTTYSLLLTYSPYFSCTSFSTSLI